jgi:uncharacterized RDD family membrane protein YckC
MSTSQPPPGWSESESPAATQPEQSYEQQQAYEPPVAKATGASGPRAGFWRRFGAALVDGLIVGIPSGILEVALKGVGYFLAIVLWLGYFTYFEGGPEGAGFGKRALGIRVIDFDTGGPIGYGRAFIRAIGRWVSAVVIYIGYLWMLWDKEKQCWHDKFAGDVVVPTQSYPVS